jgi:Flp pilus assembly protein TadB
LGLAIWVLNPDYVGRLFDTTIGNIMLGVALVAMAIGFFWMKKIIDIEI